MLVRIITVMGVQDHIKLVHTMQNQLTFIISRASSITSSTKIIWITSRRVARRRFIPVEVVIDEGVI